VSDERDSRAAALVREYMAAFPEWTSDEYEAEAVRLARTAELDAPINRAPSSIAAGAVYAAGLLVNEKRTQAEVLAVCDVSEPTLRAAYTEIVEYEGYRVEPNRGGRESSPGRLSLLRGRAASLFSGGDGE